MITAKVMIERFRVFADAHFFINSFSHGELTDKDLKKNQLYPLMHVVYNGASYTEGSKLYDFDVMLLDMSYLSVDKQDMGNQVVSDSEQAVEDILADLRAGWNIFDVECVLQTASISPVLHETKNVLCGVNMSVTIEVPYDHSACFAPLDGVLQADGTLPYVRRGILTTRTYDGNVRVLSTRTLIVPNGTLADGGDGEAELRFPVINTLGDIPDVDLTNLQAGDTIIWDETIDTWVAGSGGGGGAVSSVNGKVGSVILYGTDISLSVVDATSVAQWITDLDSAVTTLQTDLAPVKGWYDRFGGFFTLTGTASSGQLYFGGSSQKMEVYQPDSTSTLAGVYLRAGTKYIRIQRNGYFSTDQYDFPRTRPVAYGGDTLIQEPQGGSAYRLTWGAPFVFEIIYQWTSGYFNLTNGVDNRIPWTKKVKTQPVTNVNDLTSISGILSGWTAGLYKFCLRVHLYDQTGGTDLTAGVRVNGTYRQKLIDVGPTSSGSTDRIYEGTGVETIASGDSVDFVINPSANSPYPADTGGAFTQVIITWMGPS